MNNGFGDARLEELKMLSEIERVGTYEVEQAEGARLDMIVHIVDERFVNDRISTWPGKGSDAGLGGLRGESELERRRHSAYLQTLSKVLSGEKVSLQLSHKGRLRISELRQELTTGRSRESFGILWDRRHFQTGLQIALLEANESNPLALAFLDMNGLGPINNEFRHHDAGDIALRAYFHAIAAVIGDKGECYRFGGDEVLAIIPSHDSQAAKSLISEVCSLLMQSKLDYQGRPFGPLSISVGIAVTYDPEIEWEKFKDLADQAMYRAKEKTKERKPRPNAIALDGQEEIAFPE